MCSTCDFTKYEIVGENENQHREAKLGLGSLIIRSDMKGENFSLAVAGENKSEYRIYRCPTCGKQLF